MSYDQWKTTDPADATLGRSTGPYTFRCLDCAWRGKGTYARYQHAHATGHRVLYADHPQFAAERKQKESA